MVRAGAAGVNLEDRRDTGGLHDIAAQADRIAAARTAAEMLTAGTYDSCAGGIDYAEMNSRISGQSRTK